MQVGKHTLQEAVDMIYGMLNDYETEIDQAYLKAEGALDIGIKLKIAPGKEANSLNLKTSINFVTDRIKDDSERIVSESQMSLFDKKSSGLTIRPQPRVGIPCWLRGHGLGG